MNHIAVWLDHEHARIFHVDGAKVDALAVDAPHQRIQRHDKHTVEREHPADALHYCQQIAKALGEAESVLVIGPGTAKLELIRHLHRHDVAIEKKVVGVETVDHPTDRQIVAYAKKYFVATDRAH